MPQVGQRGLRDDQDPTTWVRPGGQSGVVEKDHAAGHTGAVRSPGSDGTAAPGQYGTSQEQRSQSHDAWKSELVSTLHHCATSILT
ncbi:hypothetical protein GCM10009844_16530 [Nocardioides koreensis]|uniref:Uncharacterized protein n=1 Tax=Nocardioides koreensis TaxID=433651 RepID=A0ABP5LBH7_9ACTN